MGNKDSKLKCHLQKNKPSKASLTKSGTHMMSTRVVLSIKPKQRNSFKIPLVTSDPEMNSLMKHSMRSSLLSIRITLVPSKSPKWLSLSSNSLEDHEESEVRKVKSVRDMLET